MQSILYKINPLIKIFFLLFELICVYFLPGKIHYFFFLAIIIFCFVADVKLLYKCFSTFLNISPLLLTILILGFLFGHDYLFDFQVVAHISILVFLSVILIQTTSPYDFMLSVKSITPQNYSANIIVFLYGLVVFFATLVAQFKHTITAYKLGRSKIPDFGDIAKIFSSFIEKTLQKVHFLSLKSKLLLGNSSARRLSLFDSIPLIIIILQISLIL